MLGELTSKIKLHVPPGPMSVQEALSYPRLVRKELEVPLVMRGRDPLLVGRDESLANLVIKDGFISRTHAAIFREEDGNFYVQDLHSKNGTYLNGERLDAGQRSSRPLNNGDRIGFNIVEFKFIVPEEVN
jgi:pSer/pThr/pTyr-binding forkhead associated (FHA) protein